MQVAVIRNKNFSLCSVAYIWNAFIRLQLQHYLGIRIINKIRISIHWIGAFLHTTIHDTALYRAIFEFFVAMQRQSPSTWIRPTARRDISNVTTANKCTDRCRWTWITYSSI